MQEDYKYKGLRKQMVKTIADKGISDASVLRAMETVPRHLFIERDFWESAAYEDKAFPIGAGQTISQPYTVAYQTSLLQIQKNDKVLEIGTGCGYQTAVLIEMGAKVFSIERQKILYERAKILLPDIGYIARLFYGDGYKGLPTYAPFDKVIVTAGAPSIPDDLVKQLKIGGIMVIPVGEGAKQIMTTVLKRDEDKIELIELNEFKFVPLLGNKE